MSEYASNSNTLKQINKLNNRTFKVAVICHYNDEKKALESMGADFICNYKTEVGEVFAEHAIENSAVFLDELFKRNREKYPLRAPCYYSFRTCTDQYVVRAQGENSSSRTW